MSICFNEQLVGKYFGMIPNKMVKINTFNQYILLFIAQKDKLTLFVKNLPEDVKESSLEEHFEGCAGVKIPTKPDGGFRG